MCACPGRWPGNNFISFMRKQKEIRCGEFSNYVKGWACGWEKEISFWGAFSYRRKEASTRLLRKPNRLTSAATVPSIRIFLPPPISLSIDRRLCQGKRDIEEILYIYIYAHIYRYIYVYKFSLSLLRYIL